MPEPAMPRYLLKLYVCLYLPAVDVGVPDFQDPGFYASWAVDPLLVGAHNGTFDRCQVSATLLATDQVGLQSVN
jgi:hypothetical protein